MTLITGVASAYPKPADLKAFIRAEQYDPHYSSSLPAMYSWPDA